MIPDSAKPKVLVAVPCMGWIHTSVVLALLKIQQDKRFLGRIFFFTGKPTEDNMNKACKLCVDQGFDYLISIDDDNAPVHSPLDLVFLDKDIVGLPTPVWMGGKTQPWWLNAMVRNGPEEGAGWKPYLPEKPGELCEVDAVGAGCIVIARRVLEKVKAPFNRKWSEDGIQEVGLDFNFCRRSKEAGFEVWAHYGYPCNHIKELSLGEMASSMRHVFEVHSGIDMETLKPLEKKEKQETKGESSLRDNKWPVPKVREVVSP